MAVRIDRNPGALASSALIVAVMLFLLMLGANIACYAQTGGQESSVTTKGEPPDLGLRGTMPVPVQVEPAAAQLDRSGGQDWQRASMRLSGSMCPACLLELEGKLRALPGVVFARISREAQTKSPSTVSATDHNSGNQKQSEDKSQLTPRFAATVIIFDQHASSLDRLQQCIKHEKYKPLDVKVVEFSVSGRS